MLYGNNLGYVATADAGSGTRVYSELFGFAAQAERIDPHVHIQPQDQHIDLARLADLIRPRERRIDAQSAEEENERANLSER